MCVCVCVLGCPRVGQVEFVPNPQPTRRRSGREMPDPQPTRIRVGVYKSVSRRVSAVSGEAKTRRRRRKK